MKITGAEIIVQSLIKENVEFMFGYPGGVVIPIFHHIFNAPFIQLIDDFRTDMGHIPTLMFR